MAELLIRVRDKVNPNDPYLDVQCSKRGDVIAVCENGWQWGSKELTNPDWRILALPNVSVNAASVFLSSEKFEEGKSLRMLRRRAMKLDLASVRLTQAIRTWIADDTRAIPRRVVNAITDADLEAMRIEKPPLQDPGVIG